LDDYIHFGIDYVQLHTPHTVSNPSAILYNNMCMFFFTVREGPTHVSVVHSTSQPSAVSRTAEGRKGVWGMEEGHFFARRTA